MTGYSRTCCSAAQRYTEMGRLSHLTLTPIEMITPSLAFPSLCLDKVSWIQSEQGYGEAKTTILRSFRYKTAH